MGCGLGGVLLLVFVVKELKTGGWLLNILSTSMSRPNNIKDFELRNINEPYNGERPRTSSAAALRFQQLKAIQQNDVAADRSRRSSRVSKGLPDAPRPKKVHVGTSFSIQKNLATRRSWKSGRPMRRQGKSRTWTSIRSLWRNCCTALGLVLKRACGLRRRCGVTNRRATTSCPRRRRLLPGSAS